MDIWWSRLTWGLLLLSGALITHDTLCIFLRVSCDYYRALHQGIIAQGITLIVGGTLIALSVQALLSVVRHRFRPLLYQLAAAGLLAAMKMAGFWRDPFICAFESWR